MNKFVSFAIVIVLALLASIALPGQNLYKSVGPDGKVVYSDRPPSEGKLQKTLRFDNLPGSSLPAASAAQIEQLRRQKAAQQAAVRQDQVVMFTASWCGHCKKAKAYMARKGIGYREYDVDTEQGMVAYAQAGGGDGVPLLLYRGQRVEGYSDEAYDALFAGNG